MTSARARVGISGWRYATWRGDFYPRGLPQRLELAYVGERMNSVELNGSFYSLQRPESYRRWRDAVPDDVVFAVKGSRYITHMLRLRGTETALANFLASGVLALGPKLGPILWQLPERQGCGYTPDELDAWAARIAAWTDGSRPGPTDRAPPDGRPRDVYVYFDNDGQGHAPHDALALATRLKRA